MMRFILCFLVSTSALWAATPEHRCQRLPRNADQIDCLVISKKSKFQPEALELCNQHRVADKWMRCVKIIADRKYQPAHLARCEQHACNLDRERLPGEAVVEYLLPSKLNRCLKSKQ
jgi:hypothetical protein